MQRIKMLKTACGPDGSFAAGKKYIVDDDTAKAWCAKPSPAAVMVVDVVVEPEKVVDAPQDEIVEEEKPKPRAKRPAKYRPGKGE